MDDYDQRVLTRLWAGVAIDPDTDCWIWQRAKSWDGYGFMKIHSKMRRVHRVAYELLVGLIPEELTLDHLCRRTLCCNPAHLEPVTTRENIMRGTAPSARHAAKSHCDLGHPLNNENTYLWRGWRQCRICKRAADRRRTARLKGR